MKGREPLRTSRRQIIEMLASSLLTIKVNPNTNREAVATTNYQLENVPGEVEVNVNVDRQKIFFPDTDPSKDNLTTVFIDGAATIAAKLIDRRADNSLTERDVSLFFNLVGELLSENNRENHEREA